MDLTANVIPWFRLPDGRGGELGPADLLQRSDMLVGVVHAGCGECAALLEELARRRDDLAAHEVAPLAVVMGAPDGAAAGVAACFDEDGHATALLAGKLGLTPGQAWLLVGDRFGQVRTRFAVHGAEPAGLVAEALGWFDFLQEQCDECGAPEW